MATIFRLFAIYLFVISSSVVNALPFNEGRTVVAAFPKNFPPEYQMTPEGVPYGFAIEVMDEVSRRAGLNVHYLPQENWEAVWDLVLAGEVDLVPNMGVTPQRAEAMLFTEPYDSFNIRIFTNKSEQYITNLSDLKGKRVSTTPTNVANTLAEGLNITQHSDAEACVRALLSGEVDAVILPDVITQKLLSRLDPKGTIMAVGEALDTVNRAVAVSKNSPELFELINATMNEYLHSEEFSDTRVAWNRDKDPLNSVGYLINLNIVLVALLIILISSLLHHKFKRLEKSGASFEADIEIRIISLVGVLFLATLLTSAASIWFLYDAAFQGQKQRLMNTAQSRARLIESITRFDLSNRHPLGLTIEESKERAIAQVRHAHQEFSGIGRTGEFTFAKRSGDDIEFILSQRHSITSKPSNVPWRSNDAEPMRRALSNLSGTLVGLDYRGVLVLAAHEPVRILDAGIVAKVDLYEVRLPFIRATLIILAITLTILAIGILFFFSLTTPILTKLSHAYVRLRAIIDHSPALIFITDSAGHAVYASPSAKTLTKIPNASGEETVKHKDGSAHTYLTAKFPLSAQEKEFGFCQISTDITKRVATETELKQFEQVFLSTTEGILITDANNRIVTVNNAFEDITGFKKSEVVGKNPRILQSARHSRDFYKNFWQSLNKTGLWRGEIWNRKKTGEVYPELLSISTIYGGDDRVANYVAVFSDITKQKESQNQLYDLAYHDPLTKLPNRLLFHDRLDHALKQAHRESTMMALFAIDLDRFKYINDSLGHPIGDTVLKETATRLMSLVRETDTVARMGGDEFTVIADGFTDYQSISGLASKIVRGMAHNLNINEQNIASSVSLGISLYPEDGTTTEELLKNADAALYKAKELGRNNFQYYTEDLSKSAFERLVLENQIVHGLEHEEFTLYYQPQFEIRTGRLVSAEALVRWNHPELGITPPDRFIPIAEDTGLIIPLGAFILMGACTQAKQWLDKGYELEAMAVNLSGAQIERSGLFDMVVSTLASTGFPAKKLELEVTESFIMRELKNSIFLLESLSELGISIAIDDFGTGYSSLSYLKRLPISTLKIDKSFIRDIPDDEEDSAIAKAIIALGHSLGLLIVAEGVELQSQLTFLENEDCDLMQGYYKGKPVPADQFEREFLKPQKSSLQ